MDEPRACLYLPIRPDGVRHYAGTVCSVCGWKILWAQLLAALPGVGGKYGGRGAVPRPKGGGSQWTKQPSGGLMCGSSGPYRIIFLSGRTAGSVSWKDTLPCLTRIMKSGTG